MKVLVKATGKVENVRKHTLNFVDGSSRVYYSSLNATEEFEPYQVTELDDITESKYRGIEGRTQEGGTPVPACPPIDWEQRRFEIAQAYFITRSDSDTIYGDAEEAARAADALIEELKKQTI